MKKEKLNSRTKSEIRFIVGKIHVCQSNEYVKNDILTRLNNCDNKNVDPNLIIQAVNYAIKIHNENKELCKYFNL